MSYRLILYLLKLIYRSNCGHAAGDSQAGGDGGQDGCYCLNDEFPSFLFHDYFFKVSTFLFVECGVRSEE